MKLAAFLLLFICLTPLTSSGQIWKRHTIDASSRGADGVRLTDANGDGLPDIATGWEEGGVVRAYLHPGYAKVRGGQWPQVTVGKVRSAEDAVLVDLDNDGAVDMVSCCEGRTKTMYVHWAPPAKEDYLKADKWSTQPIPVTQNAGLWMYAVPMQVDGEHGVDLVVGSKGGGGVVGWLQAPADARDLDAWKFHPLYKAGWIMSIETHDLDGDGDMDLVVSDRRGKTAGVLWLENPCAAQATGAWREHRIGGDGQEVMFLDCVDLNGDKKLDIAVAIKPYRVDLYVQNKDPRQAWSKRTVELSGEGIGRAKAVRVGDIDGDGSFDLVFSCEGAKAPLCGCFWLKHLPARDGAGRWKRMELAGPLGLKYDHMKLLDMDDDGDLDVLTCEERDQLGVFWYENPHRDARNAQEK